MRLIVGAILAISSVALGFVAMSCTDLGGLSDTSSSDASDDGRVDPGDANVKASDTSTANDGGLLSDAGQDATITSDMQCASEICELPARECCLQQQSAASARCINSDEPDACVPRNGSPVGFGECDDDGDCAAQGKPGAMCCGTKSGDSFVSLQCTVGQCSNHLCNPATDASTCAVTEKCGSVLFYTWLHVCQPK